MDNKLAKRSGWKTANFGSAVCTELLHVQKKERKKSYILSKNLTYFC